MDKKLGWAAIIGSIMIPLASVFAPIISDWYGDKAQREFTRQLEEQKIVYEQKIEGEKRKFDVVNLLMQHYFGKSSEQQLSVIDFLQAVYPEYLIRIGDVLKSKAKNEEVKESVDDKVRSLKIDLKQRDTTNLHKKLDIKK